MWCKESLSVKEATDDFILSPHTNLLGISRISLSFYFWSLRFPSAIRHSLMSINICCQQHDLFDGNASLKSGPLRVALQQCHNPTYSTVHSHHCTTSAERLIGYSLLLKLIPSSRKLFLVSLFTSRLYESLAILARGRSTSRMPCVLSKEAFCTGTIL
jgi:hypothetical protein